jgi:hypothetical protein
MSIILDGRPPFDVLTLEVNIEKGIFTVSAKKLTKVL